MKGEVPRRQIHELGHTRPDISAFLRFSKENVGTPFRALWYFGGIEFCYSYEADFQQIGVDGRDLAECMDGNTDAIRQVSQTVLAAMDQGNEKRRAGQSHLVSRGLLPSHAAVSAFVLASLDALEQAGICEPIPDLYYLLSLLLFPGPPEAESVRASKNLRGLTTSASVAYFHQNGTVPSFRLLAKAFGKAPSTISRLYESREDIEKEVRFFADFFDDGQFSHLLRLFSLKDP